MKIISKGAVAVIAIGALALVGCNQATSSGSTDKGSGGNTVTGLVMPLDFENGVTTGIAISQPVVNGVTNAFAGALNVGIANDQTDTQGTVRGFDGNGNQTLGGSLVAFNNGAKSLSVDYGISVSDGRVAASIPVTTTVADLQALTNNALSFALKVPDVSNPGGVGVNVLVTDSDGKVYSSSAVNGDGTWCYALMDRVWVTYNVATNLFKTADATPLLLSAAITAGKTVTNIKFYFRFNVTASLAAVGTTSYKAYLDNIKFY